jgi:hypothetical protein
LHAGQPQHDSIFSHFCLRIMNFSDQVGVASLGLGAFSTTVDLLHVCLKAYHAWKELGELDDDLNLLKTKLLLQQSLLDSWQRDWYGFTAFKRMTSSRQRLLQQNNETIKTTMSSIKNQLVKLEPLRTYAQDNRKLTTAEGIKFVTNQKKNFQTVLAELDFLVNKLHQLLPPLNPNIQASQTVLILNQGDQQVLQMKESEDFLDWRNHPLTMETYTLKKLEESLASNLLDRIKNMHMALPEPKMTFPSSRLKIDRVDELSPESRGFGKYNREKPVIVEWKKYDGSWRGEKWIKLRGRIDNLARFLSADSKPKEMLTLKCVGYCDRPAESRFGFCFEYPEHCDDSVVAQKNLLDQSADGKNPQIRRPVSNRVCHRPVFGSAAYRTVVAQKHSES